MPTKAGLAIKLGRLADCIYCGILIYFDSILCKADGHFSLFLGKFLLLPNLRYARSKLYSESVLPLFQTNSRRGGWVM
jgi:hypothetical protein